MRIADILCPLKWCDKELASSEVSDQHLIANTPTLRSHCHTNQTIPIIPRARTERTLLWKPHCLTCGDITSQIFQKFVCVKDNRRAMHCICLHTAKLWGYKTVGTNLEWIDFFLNFKKFIDTDIENEFIKCDSKRQGSKIFFNRTLRQIGPFANKTALSIVKIL